MESGEPSETDHLTGSTDYTKYGIDNVPHYTTTTALGKTKTFAGLYAKEWAFLIISTINILAAAGLTIYRLVVVVKDDPASPDFTFTILLLINAAFSAFYVIHGVLRERKYELYAFMGAILVVLLYCIFEYAVFNVSGRTTLKLVRLIISCVLAPPNIYLAWLAAHSFGYLEFRIVGASQFLQSLYRQAAIFSCLLKFDLQTTISFVVLALNEGTDLALGEKISLGIGLPFSLMWTVLGWLSLRKELRAGAILFGVIGFAKPGYYLYKIITVYIELEDKQDFSNTIVYSLLASGSLALLIWFILTVEMCLVYKNFGKGLRERAFEHLAQENRGQLTGRMSRWQFSN